MKRFAVAALATLMLAASTAQAHAHQAEASIADVPW
jgi:hypothetical protein